jgi:hypothetical protein
LKDGTSLRNKKSQKKGQFSGLSDSGHKTPGEQNLILLKKKLPMLEASGSIDMGPDEITASELK